jgi:hypothetical protein
MSDSQYPIEDADLSSRTPWFGRDEKPVRVGWYECRHWAGHYRKWKLNVWRWWDGHVFRFSPNSLGVASDFGFHPYDQWRGRVEP